MIYDFYTLVFAYILILYSIYYYYQLIDITLFICIYLIPV